MPPQNEFRTGVYFLSIHFHKERDEEEGEEVKKRMCGSKLKRSQPSSTVHPRIR